MMMQEGNVDGTYVCENCGKVYGYEVAIEFADYYNSCWRIVCKQSTIESITLRMFLCI